MLKKTITYDTYVGDDVVPVTEDFYFNLNKSELVELEVSTTDGFAEGLQAIVASNNGRLIIDSFKRIILLAYGQKSEDGKRFVKNDQLREEFSQTDAYSVLFMELATDAGAAASFINGVVPKGLTVDEVPQVPVVEDVQLPEVAPPAFQDMSPDEFAAWQASRQQ